MLQPHPPAPHGRDSALRQWGLHLAARGGKQAKSKAVVAVAREASRVAPSPLEHARAVHPVLRRNGLEDDPVQRHVAGKISAERSRLESRLTSIRNRMDSAYVDKLHGKIPEDFWERKMTDWRMEEQQIKMAMDGLSSAAQRIFELANKAYSLYVSQDSSEKAKLLFSNGSVDAVSVTPTYRKPFDIIFKRAVWKEWSGRLDSN